MHPLQMLVTYPINAMRNMAMLLARTELVFPMDIDFVPSRDFSDIVLDSDRRAVTPVAGSLLSMCRHADAETCFLYVTRDHGENCRVDGRDRFFTNWLFRPAAVQVCGAATVGHGSARYCAASVPH